MKTKIIVAHPGKQHSYRTASALKKEGFLFKYITTIYNSEKSFSIRILKHLLPYNEKRRIVTRKNKDLDDNDVIQFCVISGYIEAFLSRFPKMNCIYRFWQQFNADRFGKKVAIYAIKNNVNAIIIYDSNAFKCFEILKKKKSKIIRIMDVSHINRIYQHEIVFNLKNNDVKDNDDCLPYLFPKWYLKRIIKENKNTDYFLVPSSFVAESLEYSGINEKNIFEIPYGSNFNFNSKKKLKKTNKIVFLFVGKVSFAKGITFLLQAFEKISDNNVELRLVGECDASKWFYKKYCDRTNICFVGKKLHEDVLEELSNADVFILPSLMEGMSLAGLEAMSCGLPIICTNNSGLDKFVDEGKNGFIVEPKNADQLYEKLKWCIGNKKNLITMGEYSLAKSRMCTWENYESNFINTIIEILNKEKIFYE